MTARPGSMLARYRAQQRRAAARPAPAATSTADRDAARMAELASRTGVSARSLARLGVTPDMSRQSAQRRIERVLGSRGWACVVAAGSPWARDREIDRVLASRRVDDDEQEPEPEQRRRSRNSDDDEPEDVEAGEPDDQCGRSLCGHRRDAHDDDGGRCYVDGCGCREFVEPADEDDEDDEQDARRARRRGQDEPDDEAPDDEAMLARVAARTGRPLAEVRRSARRLDARPAAVTERTCSVRQRASKRSVATITAEDRRIAAQRGLDPAAVARSRRALFGGGGK